MILKLEIPGTPTPKQSVRANPVYDRNGLPVIYDDRKSGKRRVLIKYHQPKEIKQKERYIAFVIKHQLPENFQILNGPIFIRRLDYIFPPLRSFSQKKYSEIARGRIYHKTTSPDITDNLAKMLFDVMEGIIYLNDSQVCEMASVRKIYGLKPGIYLTIEGFHNNNQAAIQFAENVEKQHE